MCLAPLTLGKSKETQLTNKMSNQMYKADPTAQWHTLTRQVPCGVCAECVRKHRNGWSFRLYHELQASHSAYFLTCTYGKNDDQYGQWGSDPPVFFDNGDDDYVDEITGEIISNPFNGFYTLDEKHHTDFLKRVRQVNKRKYGIDDQIKYYMCGEYGDQYGRPHYHYIIFNLAPELVYNARLFSKNVWKQGQVDVGNVTLASINYVTQYIVQSDLRKKQRYKDKNGIGWKGPMLPFNRMSRNLGNIWLSDSTIEHYKTNLKVTVDHPAGFQMPMPRYYADRIFDEADKREIREWYNSIYGLSLTDFETAIRLQTIHKKQKDYERKKNELRKVL